GVGIRQLGHVHSFYRRMATLFDPRTCLQLRSYRPDFDRKDDWSITLRALRLVRVLLRQQRPSMELRKIAPASNSRLLLLCIVATFLGPLSEHLGTLSTPCKSDIVFGYQVEGPISHLRTCRVADDDCSSVGGHDSHWHRVSCNAPDTKTKAMADDRFASMSSSIWLVSIQLPVKWYPPFFRAEQFHQSSNCIRFPTLHLRAITPHCDHWSYQDRKSDP